jgi:hypothetical protein
VRAHAAIARPTIRFVASLRISSAGSPSVQQMTMGGLKWDASSH